MTENKMSPKEYLSQAMYIDQRIDSKLQQVATLRESAAKVTATLTDMPRSASPNPQAMENTIVKIIDLENEFNRDVDRLVDLKAEVKRVISRLSSPDSEAGAGTAVSVLQAVVGNHGNAWNQRDERVSGAW